MQKKRIELAILVLFSIIVFSIPAFAEDVIELPETTTSHVSQLLSVDGQTVKTIINGGVWHTSIKLADSTKPEMIPHGADTTSFQVFLRLCLNPECIKIKGSKKEKSDHDIERKERAEEAISENLTASDKNFLSQVGEEVCNEIVGQVTRNKIAAMEQSTKDNNGVGFVLTETIPEYISHDLPQIKGEVRTNCLIEYQYESNIK